MSTTRSALIEWKKRSGLTSFAHHRVQAKFSKRHTRLGISLMICTTAMGTSSFVELGDSQSYVNAIVILLTITAGVLGGIQTFLDYKTLGEHHKKAASGWEDLRWHIERILSTTPEPEDVDKRHLDEMCKLASEYRKQSPTIHNDDWDEAVKLFEPSSIE